MLSEETCSQALVALTLLCERQEELSLNAHLALMEAFNDLAGEGCSSIDPGPAAPKEAIPVVLDRARSALDRLALNGVELEQRLRFLRLRDLVDLAIRES